MRGALLVLAAVMAGCGAKGPPRAPGASAPPEALAPPPKDCLGCILTVPQPGLEAAEPIGAGAVPPVDVPAPGSRAPPAADAKGTGDGPDALDTGADGDPGARDAEAADDARDEGAAGDAPPP